MQYYAVKFGEVVRFSKKVKTPEEACKHCFGRVHPQMLIKALGTRKRVVIVMRSQQAIKRSEDGWFSLNKE